MTFPSTPTAHLVQQSTDTNGFTSSSIDTSGTSLLVVCVSWYTGSGGGAVLSDSKSNTWTGLTAKSPAGDVAGSNRLYYAVNPTVGAGHTFTITGTASYPAIAVQAWASADTSTPFDVENGNGTDFDITFKSIKPGSITPGSNDELVVAGFGNVNAVGTLSIDSSFTISDSGDRITNGIGVGMAYLVQTTAVAVNPLWSFTSANDHTTALIASFKCAAGGTTVALTGVSGTGSVGSLGAQVSTALSGNAGTGSVGSVAASVSIALTGNQATGSVGTVTPVSGVFIALTGNEATGSVGSVAPAVSIALTGVSATGSLGSLSVGADTSTATPGFFRLPSLIRRETEEAKRARRIREGTIPDDRPIPVIERPQLKDDAAEFARKSAKHANAMLRLNAERDELRQKIATLDARAAAELDAKRRAKIGADRFRQEQALALASVQEEMLREEMEAMDAAYVSMVFLTLQ